MENTKVYTDENGNQIKLEEISTFKIEELNKVYLAYTINDDGTSSNVQIRFVELLGSETDHPVIKPVEDYDAALVVETFNAMVDSVQ